MDDLISRQAAIDAMKNMCSEDEDGITVSRANVDSMLRVLPSVQPERKKGKWISDRLCTVNGGTYGVRRCSNCESYYQDVGYGWNFCPNCGCEMRQEGEDHGQVT